MNFLDMDGLGAVAGGFEIRTANECVAFGAGRAAEPLFGDLWRTGEISVMFGEPGCGKSVLGVQIAEAIARRRSTTPFECRAKRQKVIYLDLESTPEQFARRYSDDDGKAHSYRFSANLHHVCVTGSAETWPADLEAAIERTGARVVVIDSIIHLMRSTSSKEAARTMRELRRLRRLHGLSILVISHASRTGLSRRGIEACDMPFAGMLAAFADNAFAVGRVAADPANRYIKHVRPAATALLYGAAHVPWFRITRRGNFTWFSLQGFAREALLRGGDQDRSEWARVRRIRELKDAGMSVRAIGAMLKMPKSTVQRYVELAMDEAFAPLPEPDPWDGFVAAPRTDTYEWLDEYDAAISEASREADAAPEEERWEIAREHYLLHLARANARKEFEKHGTEPTLAETLEKMRPETDGWPERWGGDLSEPEAAPTAGFDDDDRPSTINDPTPIHLERALDSNDEEVFVEKRDPHTGRMMVWYKEKTYLGVPTGTYTRWKREGYGILGESVESLPGRGP